MAKQQKFDVSKGMAVKKAKKPKAPPPPPPHYIPTSTYTQEPSTKPSSTAAVPTKSGGGQREVAAPPVPKTGFSHDMTTYQPDYSSAKTYDDAIKIYQDAVRKYNDPNYTYQGEFYSPLLGKAPKEQTALLARAMKGTPLGQQTKQQATQQYLQKSGRSQVAPENVTAQHQLHNAIRQAMQQQVGRQEYMAGQQPGMDQGEILRNLYYQMAGGHDPNLVKDIAKTPQAQHQQFLATPQGMEQTAMTQMWQPMAKDRAENLNRAADVMDQYFQLASSQRTPYLYSLGYTSLADVYRGLDQYIPTDAPNTPEVFREAAANLQTPQGVQEMAQKEIIKQATAQGKDTTALRKILANAGWDPTKLQKSGMSPIDALIAAYQSGAEIPTGTSSATSAGASTVGTFKGLGG